MATKPTLTLIVIRVSDIDRAAEVYAALGMTFQREQHGNGPVHYSSSLGQTVFELYPATAGLPVTSCRLGFSVENLDDAVAKWKSAGGTIISQPTETRWGLRAVVADYDGHKIELTQNCLQEVGRNNAGQDGAVSS